MAEKDVNARLRKMLMTEVEAPVFYRRIEDASGAVGTFDTFIQWGAHALWVELKETETPGAKPDMRPGQPAFGRALIKAGGRALVLVGNRRQPTYRLLSGDTTGPDWREKLIHEGPMDLTMWAEMLHG